METNKSRRWQAEEMGSVIDIKAPINKFQSYERFDHEKGIVMIQGVAPTEDDVKSIDRNHFLKFYNLGKRIDNIFNDINIKGIGSEYNSNIYRIIYDWVVDNGLPYTDYNIAELHDEKQRINSSERSILDRLDVNKFARNLLMLCDMANFIYDTHNPKHKNTKSESHRILGTGDKNLDMSKIIPAHLGSKMHMIHTLSYDENKHSYSLVLVASDQLSAAYAQLAYSLISPDNNLERCSVCNKLFVPEGREKVCGEDCRRKRASNYVIATNKKPPEKRDQSKNSSKGKRVK